MIIASFIVSLLALVVASFAVAISFYDVDSNHNGGLSDKILRLIISIKSKLQLTFSRKLRIKHKLHKEVSEFLIERGIKK